MRYRKLFVLLISTFFYTQASATEAEQLFKEMRQKLNGVNDYVADVKMKIDVSFMRIPPLNGKLYFKAPDKMRLDRKGGISILPKNGMNMTLNNLIPSDNVAVIDAGYATLGDKKVHIIKLVPENDERGIILTKVWVDEERMLALRTETTTRDNGTINMDLEFGKYASVGLPDKVTFLIDVKDYKLPKGVTMDYDGNADVPVNKKAVGKPKKGKIEITYLSYSINKGIPDAVFTKN
jgi:outer membrane lipoprotein-sorting protein